MTYTRAQAEAMSADLSAALIAVDSACRTMANDHDPEPLRRLVEGGKTTAWAASVLLSHVYEYGPANALGEALESLTQDVEARV